MERGNSGVLLVTCIVMGMLVVGHSIPTPSSFRDCYAKCFLFCMIEPSQTLCTCTTQCLKQCIFPTSNSTEEKAVKASNGSGFHFCKLGCAHSFCSNLSTKHTPNGEKVDKCVGSCSEMCIKSYLSP